MDPLLLAFIAPIVTGALGFLIARELQRSDGIGSRQGRQGENIATLTQAIRTMQEAVERLAARDDALDAKLALHNEALNNRIDANRQLVMQATESWTRQMSDVSGSIARLDATMGALKEAVDRLITAERERPAPQPVAQPASMIEQLRQLVELQRLMGKQVA